VRGIFLKGNGLAILWPQLLALLAIGVAVLSVSTLRFRRGLDRAGRADVVLLPRWGAGSAGRGQVDPGPAGPIR
jgi:hypothetical protein